MYLSPTESLSILVMFTLILGLGGLALRVPLWLAGTAAKPRALHGLLQLPRRYLVDVHHAVGRTPRAAQMHVPTALGFLTILVGLAMAWVMPLAADIVMILGAFVLCGGNIINLWRRHTDGEHLTKPWYGRLPWALLTFAAATAVAAIDDALGARSIVILACLAVLMLLPIVHFSWGLAAGPLRHVPIGILHLIFHPRDERFIDRGRGAALRPMQMNGQKFGAENARDLPWTALLGADACVQCGKCEAVCPAYAAEQPLNPKAFIADLAAQAALDWNPYVGNLHPGGSPKSGAISPDTLWACTTCRACVEACPMLIEHVDAIVEFRRGGVLERDEVPLRSGKALDSIRNTGNASDVAPSERTAWTIGLAVPRIQQVDDVDILLWQGEGAFQPLGRRTLRALAEILSAAGMTYAILGEEEIDCGDLARRIGDEFLFQETAASVICMLRSYRFRRIVTADPHVFHSLKNEYPNAGGQWTVLHHTEILQELIADGKISLRRNTVELTYHDPCYLARYNGQTEAPRAVLAALGVTLREMVRHGTAARCCGGGGAAPLADIPGRARISDQRMADAVATGVTTVAVACPGCAGMLSGVPGNMPEVRDIAELVAESLIRPDCVI